MALKTRVRIITPPAPSSLNAYANFSNIARHLNNPVVLRPLAPPSHIVVNCKVYGTPTLDPVVLRLNKLTQPMIALTKLVSTNTTTTKIVEEANKIIEGRQATTRERPNLFSTQSPHPQDPQRTSKLPPQDYRHGAHPPNPPTDSQRATTPPKPLPRQQHGRNRPRSQPL
jgi:hypothetical protein